jgi:hypothetical protein
VLKPVFSPDGVHFAFMDPAYTYNEQFNANFKLFVEELDTRMLSRRMVAFPAATGFQVRNNLESYTWSPDSSRLMIFLDERSNYYERSAGYHIFQFILTNGMLLEYERLYGESPRMTWAPDSIRQLFAITQTRAGGGYSVVLSMLDTSTRLTRTYEPGAVLMSEDYIFIDKMFWLPAQND